MDCQLNLLDIQYFLKSIFENLEFCPSADTQHHLGPVGTTKFRWVDGLGP